MNQSNITKYYLFVNKTTKLPEKMIFISLSDELRKLNFELFKEYSWNFIKNNIYKEDLDKEIQILKSNFGKNFINLRHRFFVKNSFYIVDVNLKFYSDEENYFIYYGKNNVINDKIEDKILWNILLKNNKEIILIKSDNKNNFNFLNLNTKFNKEKIDEAKRLLKLELKKLQEELVNSENLILTDDLDLLIGIEQNEHVIKNNLKYKEIVLNLDNNQIYLFKVLYFKFLKNKKESFYYVLLDKNELLFYQYFYKMIDFIINNKENLIDKIFKNNENSMLNLEDIFFVSNTKQLKLTGNNYFLEHKFKIEDKNIYLYIKKFSFLESLFSNVVTIFKQIFERINSTIKNLENLELLKNIIDNTDEWVLITDKNKKIIYNNKEVERISGYTKEELLGQNPKIFSSGKIETEFYSKFYKVLNSTGYYKNIFLNKRKNGTYFYLESKIHKVNIGGNFYYIVLSKDITDIMENGKNGYIDKLTGLYNKNGLYYASKDKKIKYVYVIDIVEFKLYNYIHGNKKGDSLLIKLANFLKKNFNKDSLISRDYADNFIIFTGVPSMFFIKILENFNKKVKLESQIFFNIGYYEISKKISDEEDFEFIINKAKIAVNIAKNEERKFENTFKFFNEELDNNYIEKEIESKTLINKGLNEKGFFYYYQPIVNDKGIIKGGEALLRLKLKDKIYYPGDFIDYAEKTSLITKIDESSVDKIKKDFENFGVKSNFFISYNLSVNTLNNNKILDKNLNILNSIEKYGIDIVYEITERIPLLSNYIDLLNQKNLKVAIDDFGTGYSSLIYLANLKINKLKIDKVFIDKILNDKKTFHIVESILSFAEKLNIETVAEGVETKEQFEMLKKMGCKYFQGYYFYKPLPIEKLKEIFNN